MSFTDHADPLLVTVAQGMLHGLKVSVSVPGELLRGSASRSSTHQEGTTHPAGKSHGDTAKELDTTVQVRTWRGVPYGASTAGAGRFREPSPAPSWDGIREAYEFGEIAPQPTYSWTDRVIGSEDCLNLDIVRPDTDDTLPVVVYLHGGSFIVGSSHMLMLRGYHLTASMNVVYVSINFRLGALGYLDVGSLAGEACANPAVADQILALQWVRDNIAAFGGDPSNITLMGESAGGAAVLTLMTSPATAGLFHKAIAQSPPIGMIHSPMQSTMWTRNLVAKLALPRRTTIDDLRQEDAGDLVRSGQSMMWRARELVRLNSCYAPTVDGDLIPEHPIVAFEKGRQHPIPLVVGTNSDEASFSRLIFQRTTARSRAALRLLSSFDPHGAQQVLEAYDGATSRTAFAHLLADALFWAPSLRVAQAHAQAFPTWMYRFDFAPAALRSLGLGASHSMELSNIFGDPSASRASFLNRLGKPEDMAELTDVMQYQWSEFIYHSDPGEGWPRYRLHDYRYPARATRIFDAPPSVISDPRVEQRLAWEHYDMLEWGSGREDLWEQLGFFIKAT